MSQPEVKHLDRDPKTGQLLPGHSISNKSAKICAQRMTELKAIYYSAVTAEDMAEAHAAHMECIRQTKDMKVRLAAIALLYERCMGKAEQHINVQSENKTLTANVSVLSPDKQAVLEDAVRELMGSQEVRQLPSGES